tara:strand:- start:161 stop:1231 length:1071 start_codon:yes stop_codon:yes gene_type:complete
MAFSGVYKDKTILITGHTGFKGGWLSRWCKLLGAEVHGLALEPTNEGYLYNLVPPSTFSSSLFADVSCFDSVYKYIENVKPDFIFHLAAQPIVLNSYSDPYNTFRTNSLGVLNILESIKRVNFDLTSVIITSDKCYKNVEWVYGYRENDLLGGEDPYSSSKAIAEQLFYSYQNSFFKHFANTKKVSTARAGNVIGGGDWAESRIIPDCIRAWTNNKTVEIRNKFSTRPWQHVLEPLGGYLQLAMMMSINNTGVGESYNFGPSPDTNLTVGEVVSMLSDKWNSTSHFSYKNNEDNHKESKLLKLSCDKAHIQLNWNPRITVAEALDMTSEWYWQYVSNKENISSVIDSQIEKISDTY